MKNHLSSSKIDRFSRLHLEDIYMVLRVCILILGLLYWMWKKNVVILDGIKK